MRLKKKMLIALTLALVVALVLTACARSDGVKGPHLSVSLVAPSNVLSDEVVTLQLNVQNVGDKPLILWVHTWGAELQVLHEDGAEVWTSIVGGHPLESSGVVLQPGEVKAYEGDWDQRVPPDSYLVRGIFRYSMSKDAKLDNDDEIATEPKELVIAPAPTPTPRPPKGPGVEIGKEYSYTLGVHCGVRQAKFDGRWWIADPIVGINPPEDWDRYDEFGTMTLVTEDLAVFTTRSERHSYEFIPWHSDKMPFGCY